MLRQILGRAALAAAAFAAVAIVLAAILGAAAAHAAVYRLENPVYPVGVDYAAHFSADPALAFGALPFTLTIADAAVSSGHFVYSYSPSLGGTRTEDVADFISFTTPAEPTPSPIETLRISLNFDAAGNVLSGSNLLFSGDRSQLTMKGDGQNFAGFFVLGPNSNYAGAISGQLLDPSDPVPEPSSLELLLATAAGWLAMVLGRTLNTWCNPSAQRT